MTYVLSMTLKNLDEKLMTLKQNINDLNEEAKSCKDEMKEVRRLLNDLKQKKGER